MVFNESAFEEGLKQLGKKYNIPNLENLAITGELWYERGLRLTIPDYLPDKVKKEINLLFDKIAASK